MTEILTSRISFDREDFELEASNVRTKIQTYFTQLIEVIKQRQSQLISEFDEIISHYRLERIRNREKINELEKMKKYHEDMYPSSNVKELQNEFLERFKSEQSELNLKNTEILTIDFEWSTRYAREANEIGNLKINSGFAAPSPKTPLKSDSSGKSYFKHTNTLFPTSSDRISSSQPAAAHSKETNKIVLIKRKLLKDFDHTNVQKHKKFTLNSQPNV